MSPKSPKSPLLGLPETNPRNLSPNLTRSHRSPSIERLRDFPKIMRRLSQLELAVEHTLLNRTDVEEAMLLQRSFYESGHWEYAGLFSSLLMDVDMLLKLFKDERIPLSKWIDCLSKTESRGYDLLISKLESSLG